MTYDLSQLNAFIAVASAGSLGRAAKVVNLTQPALSRTVKRLEEVVGEPLFDRHSTGMRLTQIGRVLLPRAQVLIRESRLAKEEINSLRGLTTGTIRVGAIASVGCYFLPKVLPPVLSQWPDIKVQVIEGVWESLEAALVNYEVDLVLSVQNESSEQVEAIENCQWTDEVEVVVGAHHPLLSKARVSIEEILQQRWVFLPRDTEPFARLERIIGVHGFSLPPFAIETRSIALLKSMVANAGYLSWMNRPMYDAEAKAGLIFPLEVPGTQDVRKLTVFRRKAGMLPEPARRLVEEIRAFCR